MDSMREELSSLINNQTWTLVDLPSGRKEIRCGWIYKANKNEQGHFQKPEIDYNDTFAPVGDKWILRFVLTFALHLGYELF
jgi:hypothetical protein